MTNSEVTVHSPLDVRLTRFWQTRPPDNPKTRFECHEPGGSPEYRIYPHSTTQGIPIRVYCDNLVEAVATGNDHLSCLDEIYSQLVGCFLPQEGFKGRPNSPIEAALAFLLRLPKIPVEFHDEVGKSLEGRLSGYFNTEPSNALSTKTNWEQLLVATTFNSNVLLLALAIVCMDPVHMDTVRFHKNVRCLVNTTADLLETLGILQREAEDELRACHIFITRAFLWSSWQRLSMMILWQSLRSHLKNGFETNQFRSIRGTAISSDVFRRSGEGQTFNLPSYMCPWAFRSLCVERSAATFDFRRFHQRFKDLPDSHEPRCLPSETSLSTASQCDGKAVTNCRRFKGATCQNQTAHNGDCINGSCKKLYWDERSYRSIKGMKAVCIPSSQSSLRYRIASYATLAISHVWSHGQGGRPERNRKGGMNQCLHQRYSEIATKMGCDSYCMDTACIPENHSLRREAIEKINPIFESSRATLVCDKDLMNLNIDKFIRLEEPRHLHATYNTSVIHLLETLIVVLLVSDWNVRAWTLLEAARGRKNILILCAKNETISLHEALEIVSLHGAVEIPILYLTAEHLLKPSKKATQGNDNPGTNTPRMSVEASAALLSRRPASRKNDTTIIWSLMFGNTPYHTPKLMWQGLMRAPLDIRFGCGFLMAEDTPRLKCTKGLSWAPKIPALISMADEQLGGLEAHLGESENDAQVCTMKNGCLIWWCCVHTFECYGNCLLASWKARLRCLLAGLPRPRNTGQLEKICKSYLLCSKRGALLVPAFVTALDNKKPLGSSLPAFLKGKNGGTLVVVCSINSDSKGKWRKVYEWSNEEPLLEFEQKYFHIQ